MRAVAELRLALVEECEIDDRGVAVDHGEDEDLQVGRLFKVAREAVVLPGGQPERELAVAAAYQLDDQARVQGAQALEDLWVG